MADPRIREGLLTITCTDDSADELNLYPLAYKDPRIIISILEDGLPARIIIDEARARLLISALEDHFYPEGDK